MKVFVVKTCTVKEREALAQNPRAEIFSPEQLGFYFTNGSDVIITVPKGHECEQVQYIRHDMKFSAKEYFEMTASSISGCSIGSVGGGGISLGGGFQPIGGKLSCDIKHLTAEQVTLGKWKAFMLCELKFSDGFVEQYMLRPLTAKSKEASLLPAPMTEVITQYNESFLGANLPFEFVAYSIEALKAQFEGFVWPKLQENALSFIVNHDIPKEVTISKSGTFFLCELQHESVSEKFVVSKVLVGSMTPTTMSHVPMKLIIEAYNIQAEGCDLFPERFVAVPASKFEAAQAMLEGQGRIPKAFVWPEEYENPVRLKVTETGAVEIVHLVAEAMGALDLDDVGTAAAADPLLEEEVSVIGGDAHQTEEGDAFGS